MIDLSARIIGDWCKRCFGIERAINTKDRALRIVEEATEAAQAEGVPLDQVIAQTHIVYSRPAGDPSQEMGGIFITLLAYCNACNRLPSQILETEMRRILDTDPEKFRRRQAEKIHSGTSV